MQILIVSEYYHPAIGGTETQIRLVANELARRHHVEVATLSLQNKFAGPRVVLERIKLRNVLERLKIWDLLRKLNNSVLLPRFKSYVDGNVPINVISPSFLDRLRIFPAVDNNDVNWERYQRAYRSVYLRQLRKLVRGKDVVHSVADGYLGWAAEEAAREEGIPFLLTPYVHIGAHGGQFADNVAFYRRADIVFALLETNAQKLIELGVLPERLRLLGVVPLLPKTKDPDGFRAAHGIGNNPMVLFVGRMTEHKGPLALLNAAPSVWREMPNVHFFFAGPGGKQQMRWFAERPDERIRYLGLVTEQQKGDAMAACDIFCMPSTEEILPGVYLEAWSCGKAVVGGTAHGLRELIEGNGAGIVVEQDPQTIATRLIDLLRDEAKRRQMGERGRALVQRRFTESALVDTLEQAYNDLCKRARPIQQSPK